MGKHPGCTQSELTTALHLDWGHSQRTVLKLVEGGFLLREKDGRAYRLTLSEQGQRAFTASHQVFFDWDEQALTNLTPEERCQLTAPFVQGPGQKHLAGCRLLPLKTPCTLRCRVLFCVQRAKSGVIISLKVVWGLFKMLLWVAHNWSVYL